MSSIVDEPSSPKFEAIPIRANRSAASISDANLSDLARENIDVAPSGRCVSWGIPFDLRSVAVVSDEPTRLTFKPFAAPWIVIMHSADVSPPHQDLSGHREVRGEGRLGEPVAEYRLEYADGTDASHTIRRRFEIGMMQRRWGENCFAAVAHREPSPLQLLHEADDPAGRIGDRLRWGWTQTRIRMEDQLPWVNWLWAWKNPHPKKKVRALHIEPRAGTAMVFGISAGRISSNPLRREGRRKAIVTLPRGESFDPALDDRGLNKHVQLDLGVVISATPRTVYPNEDWPGTHNNERPSISERQLLVEYCAHDDACFHLPNGRPIPVKKVEDAKRGRIVPVAPANQQIELRVVEKGSKKPVPVKLHVHGEAGEYLAPIDRHRSPNAEWFEDYGPEYVHDPGHVCTYITGETTISLPLGRVFIEISKGFEVKPIRRVYNVKPGTKHITVTLDHVLPWRDHGWVTADTHVHFLSPATAQLEGAAEGVNIINLLASQWGELMTNVGDFDGKTTYGTKDAGGDGEWLVRVGTENRQHVLGHISLLGYEGRMITPLTTGGPDESAFGDSVDSLMSEWARQCRAQGGLVVMPHFPDPRCENAADLINGDIDAVEMCSWGDLYGGIDPYSLADWYRFLNCGYFVPAVGGTDKMAATTPVGAIRTYAKLPDGAELTYSAWMDAIRSGNTFATYGPLMEFSVDGRSPGERIRMRSNGGHVDVVWEVASVTVPMTKVELVVNGEIRESTAISGRSARGEWRVRVESSSWMALLIRGQYPEKPEIIAAHSSPVVIGVGEKPFFAAADAVTILEQIEGALAYLDTLAPRPQTKRLKQMRMKLTAAHRQLHNELHRRGHDHQHIHTDQHDH